MKDSLTTKELAKLLGRSEQTIRLWRMNKTGPPYVQFSKRGPVHYPKNQLGEWLATKTELRF